MLWTIHGAALADSVDLEYVNAHFNPLDQRLVGDGPLLGDGLWRAIDLMLEQCPVAPTATTAASAPTSPG